MKGNSWSALICLVLGNMVEAYNEDEKACWQIRLTNEDLFCSGSVSYNDDHLSDYRCSCTTPYLKRHITDRRNQMNVSNVYYQQVEYLTDIILAAKSSYMQLLSKFNNMKGIEAPTNDCLAIARDFYCFNAFRRCRDSEMVRIS